VLPALAAVSCLLAAIGYALAQSLTAATLNNVAFALLHVSVLLAGAWPALVGRGRSSEPSPVEEWELEEEAA
jgi:hypothetical protein